jgi:hypothetical protein
MSRRSTAQDPTIKAQFGYLYSGYRLPFWEIAEMARKLVMAAVPVFIQVQTVGSLQAVVGEILLVLFMVLTIYLHPYESKHDNWMQVSSIIGVRSPGMWRHVVHDQRLSSRPCCLVDQVTNMN